MDTMKQFFKVVEKRQSTLKEFSKQSATFELANGGIVEIVAVGDHLDITVNGIAIIQPSTADKFYIRVGGLKSKEREP